MGFYSRAVFPRFYDLVMDKPFWSEHRRQQLATVDGEILEIGIGTGLNLPHYPEHVTRIVTVDPNPGMNRRLQRRAEDDDALQYRKRGRSALGVVPRVTTWGPAAVP